MCFDFHKFCPVSKWNMYVGLRLGNAMTKPVVMAVVRQMWRSLGLCAT